MNPRYKNALMLCACYLSANYQFVIFNVATVYCLLLIPRWMAVLLK